MKILKIFVAEQYEGSTFSLEPKTIEYITKNFPDVKPVNSIYIATETKEAFESQYGSIYHNIVELLAGLKANYFAEIKFIDSKTNKTIMIKHEAQKKR